MDETGFNSKAELQVCSPPKELLLKIMTVNLVKEHCQR